MALPAVHTYLNALEARPLTTKLCTSGTLMATSDVIRQLLEQRERTTPFVWSVARTGRQTSFALFVHVPYLHVYHPWVERLAAPHAHRSGVTVVKVVLDQLLAAPPFMAVFLSYMSLLEGRSPEDTARRVEQQLWPLLLDSWSVSRRCTGFTTLASHRTRATPWPLVCRPWSCRDVGVARVAAAAHARAVLVSAGLGSRTLRHLQLARPGPRAVAGRGPPVLWHLDEPPLEQVSRPRRTRRTSRGGSRAWRARRGDRVTVSRFF